MLLSFLSACGPKCKPDDDALVEEEPIVEAVEEPVDDLQQHGGTCGPKCKPDDDELQLSPDDDHHDIPCAFCPPHGEVDASTLSHDDLVRLAAHMDWEDAFCRCLAAEDPDAEVQGCSIVISPLVL